MTSHAPKDAKVMAAILKDVGVTEYEPRVINQMLEFAYRHVTDVLDDAKIYSDYAKKKQIDAEDIKLAVQFKVDHSLSNPPPKELMLEIAKEKNSQPLPPLKQQAGLRLPPDRYCLTQQNFRLKAGLQHTVVSSNLDFDETRPFATGSGGLAGFKKRGSEKLPFSSGTLSLPMASSGVTRFTASDTPQQQPVASPADSLAGTGAAGLAAPQICSGTRGNSPFDATAAGSAQNLAPLGSTTAKPLFRLVAGTTEGGGPAGSGTGQGTPTTSSSLATSQSNQPGGNGASSTLKRKLDQLDEDYDI